MYDGVYARSFWRVSERRTNYKICIRRAIEIEAKLILQTILKVMSVNAAELSVIKLRPEQQIYLLQCISTVTSPGTQIRRRVGWG